MKPESTLSKTLVLTRLISRHLICKDMCLFVENGFCEGFCEMRKTLRPHYTKRTDNNNTWLPSLWCCMFFFQQLTPSNCRLVCTIYYDISLTMCFQRLQCITLLTVLPSPCQRRSVSSYKSSKQCLKRVLQEHFDLMAQKESICVPSSDGIISWSDPSLPFLQIKFTSRNWFSLCLHPNPMQLFVPFSHPVFHKLFSSTVILPKKAVLTINSQ